MESKKKKVIRNLGQDRNKHTGVENGLEGTGWGEV